LLTLAARVQIRTHVQPYAFSDANHALTALRSGTLTGAAVLYPKLDLIETSEVETVEEVADVRAAVARRGRRASGLVVAASRRRGVEQVVPGRERR
jgi:hypothetical protein